MKKVLIICAAGMSSSLMAKKTTEYFENEGKDISLDATVAVGSEDKIKNEDYDLYLISPQTKMKFDALKRVADENSKKIALIPFEAYVPIPMGIEKMAKLILEHL